MQTKKVLVCEFNLLIAQSWEIFASEDAQHIID